MGDKKSGGRVTSPVASQYESQFAVAAPKSSEKEGKLSVDKEKKNVGRVTTSVEEHKKKATMMPPSPSGSEQTSNWDDLDEDMAPNSDVEAESITTAGSFAGESLGVASAAAAASSTPNADLSGLSIRDRLKLRQQTIKSSGNTPIKKKSDAKHTSNEVMDFND